MNKPAISIQDICFAYDNHVIYQSFTLDIEENDISFIMGLNGCGKTTLLKIICAFLKVQSGEILVRGRKLYDYDNKFLARTIAYVPQIANMNSDFLVKDYLALGRTPYMGIIGNLRKDDYDIVESFAQDLGIMDILNNEFNQLSGGQKQIVSICRALVQESPIIILDEPMSALDMGKQAEFLSLLLKLKSEGKTIVLTSHNPNHAFAIEESSSVCFIHDGSILALGKPRQVLTPDNMLRVFGDKVSFDENKRYINFNVRNC